MRSPLLFHRPPAFQHWGGRGAPAHPLTTGDSHRSRGREWSVTHPPLTLSVPATPSCISVRSSVRRPQPITSTRLVACQTRNSSPDSLPHAGTLSRMTTRRCTLRNTRETNKGILEIRQREGGQDTQVWTRSVVMGTTNIFGEYLFHMYIHLQTDTASPTRE